MTTAIAPFAPLANFMCHANNLAQKRLRAPSGSELGHVVDSAEQQYRKYMSSLDLSQIRAGVLGPAVTAVGNYLDVAKEIEKQHSLFNWRSDYAGSVLPEFLYYILAVTFHGLGIPALFSTRDSIVEVSLSGTAGGGWDVRRKNQDLCVGLRREAVLKNGVRDEFVVPVVAIEVKTNIDINKLNGLDFSAERMKRTFPSARYFLVTETIDFCLTDNYASGSIDEIYALRKQVRSQSRRKKAPLQADVFEMLQSDVVAFIKKATENAGHVYERLLGGKLINVL